MTGRWEIALPYAVPPLSLNYHLTRPHENRINGEVRTATATLAKAAKMGRHDRVRVELHWRPAKANTRDNENPVPTMKACCDGLVDAHLVPDDDRWRMDKIMPILHDPEPGKPGAMWLVVEVLDAIPGAPPAKRQPVRRPAKAKAAAPGKGPRQVNIAELLGAAKVPGRRVAAPAASDWAARVAAANTTRKPR